MKSIISKLKSLISKITNSLSNYTPSKPLVLLFFIIPFFTLIVNNCQELDNDIYFLLNSGKYILAHGVPKIDPFTIHEGLNVVMQQWASSVIFYKIYDIFGYFGILMFMVFINAIIIYLLYKISMLISKNRLYLSTIITIAVDYILMSIFIVTRPQLFDYVILLSEIYILELYVRKKKTKSLIFLPILSLLMINLHSTSFLIMFCFMLPYIIDSLHINLGFAKTEGYKLLPLLIVTILMFLTGLINPYKLDAIKYIVSSFGKGYISEFIIEMQPLKITNVYCMLPMLTIGLSTMIYTFCKKGRFKVRYILLFLGTLFLSLTTLKATSFFYIAGLFPLADYLQPYFKKYHPPKKYSKNFKIRYSIILLMMVIVFITPIIILYKNKPYLQEKKSLDKCAKVLTKINKQDKNMVLYSDYYNGGYLEFKGLKPYIDARADVFYESNNKKKDIMKEYYEVQTNQTNASSFIESYKFTHILASDNDPVYVGVLGNGNYKLTYSIKDKKQTLYIYERIK